MRALLLKDTYTLVGEMRFLLLIIVLFALIPGGAMAGIAAVYAVMLPYTAIAYEERSGWNRYAAMMPLAPWAPVCEKYLLGWISLAALSALSALNLWITGLVHGAVDTETLLSLCGIAGAALLIMAFSLPLVFRYGVEKGRMLFVGIAVLLTLLFVALNTRTGAAPVTAGTAAAGAAEAMDWRAWLIVAGLPALGVLLQPLSVAVSVRIYEKKRRA